MNGIQYDLSHCCIHLGSGKLDAETIKPLMSREPHHLCMTAIIFRSMTCHFSQNRRARISRLPRIASNCVHSFIRPHECRHQAGMKKGYRLSKNREQWALDPCNSCYACHFEPTLFVGESPGPSGSEGKSQFSEVGFLAKTAACSETCHFERAFCAREPAPAFLHPPEGGGPGKSTVSVGLRFPSRKGRSFEMTVSGFGHTAARYGNLEMAPNA